MRYFYNSIAILVCLLWHISIFANDAEITKRTPIKNPVLDSDTEKLDDLATACLRFLSQSNDEKGKQIGDSITRSELTFESVLNTLKFIEKTQAEDREYIRIGKKQVDGSAWSYRMSKYWFLLQNFDFYRVAGNLASARQNKVNLPYGKIRVTKYAIFNLNVSDCWDKTNNTEIYALPEWVNPNTGLQQYRLRFTKQQVFDGVYRTGGAAAGKAKPLAYMSRSNVELVMLQGTFIGTFPNGTQKTFAIAGSNERPFELSQKQYLQTRYIYFSESDGLYGYGKVKEDKIKIQPGLTFAGDINHFGIGKLMLMCYEDSKTKQLTAKVGILADTGSAFNDNSFHFDFLTGVYDSKKSFYREADTIPHFCEMYILIKK